MNDIIDWGRIGRTASHVLTALAIGAIVFAVVTILYSSRQAVDSERRAVESCSARQLVAVESPGYGWVCVSFEKAVRP